MNIINHELVNLINGAKEKSSWKIYIGSFPLDFFVKPFDRKIQRIGTYL